MADLHRTQDQVRTMCLREGYRPREAHIMSAIAMIEAPVFDADTPTADFAKIGDVELADPDDSTPGWGPSYGGLQIRSRYEQRGTGGIRDADMLLHPLFNIRSGLAIKRASGFARWSTFVTGQYKAYCQDPDWVPYFPPTPGVHTVLVGQNLSIIADLYGGAFTWQELAAVNGLHEPYTIRAGDLLLLPGVAVLL